MLTPQQQSHVARVHRETGTSFDELLPSAHKHIHTHGSLEGWEHKSRSAIQEYIKATSEAKRKLYTELRAQGKVFHRLSDAEIQQVVDAALASIQSTGTVNVKQCLMQYVQTHAHTDEWLNAVLRHKPGKRTRAALQKRIQHPVIQMISTTRTEQEIMKAASTGTLSGGMNWLKKEYRVLERHEREIKAMQAQLEAHNRRLDIIESGRHWHDVAREMREQGAGYGSIGKAVGKPKSTVASFFQAK